MLRADIRQFDEPRTQALFEARAEVIQGLQTAFSANARGRWQPSVDRLSPIFLTQYNRTTSKCHVRRISITS